MNDVPISVTVIREPRDNDKGVYSVRAKEVRIGSFLLKDRLVTFSNSHLKLKVRPVDSKVEEVSVSHSKNTQVHYSNVFFFKTFI